MARETAREVAIQDAVATPIYQDQKQIVRGLGAHLTETFVGKVTGAGGAGGSLLNVPFEPAEVICLNQAGATPTFFHSVFASDAAVHLSIAAAAAANANPPVLTQVGAGDWTVALPTAMAPDAEVVTVIVRGCRDVAGSL